MIDNHIRKTISITNQILKKDESTRFAFNSIIAIGTSTGGPKAILNILRQLPKSVGVPILIVQHMPKEFTKSLAERLNVQVALNVKEAENGEVLKKDTVYIAPGDFHMEVVKHGYSYVIRLNQNPKQKGHRPSVDVLFNSIANLSNLGKIAIILTGMGSDGAEGVYKLKKADPNTTVIVESERTSVVYGMPKAALMTNAVDYVVDLEIVSEKLLSVLEGQGG